MRGWNCGGFFIGICALALGLGILIAAVFPVGCLMFLVAFLLIACGIACLKIGGSAMKIVVWKSPRILRGLLRSIFGIRE